MNELLTQIEKLGLKERKALIQKVAAGIKAEESASVPGEVLRRAKEVEAGSATLVSWESIKSRSLNVQ